MLPASCWASPTGQPGDPSQRNVSPEHPRAVARSPVAPAPAAHVLRRLASHAARLRPCFRHPERRLCSFLPRVPPKAPQRLTSCSPRP